MNHTVLIVDDEKEIREAIALYLKNEGIHAVQAKDGSEALEVLDKEEVHLIIMDVMMPKIDGIEANHNRFLF